MMFNGCEKLNYLDVSFTSWNESVNSTGNWVGDVSAAGTFVCPETLDVSVRDASHVPTDWIIKSTPVVNVDYLCFTAEEAGSVSLSVNGSIPADIQTSRDAVTWTNYALDAEGIINLAAGEKVYFRGNYRGSGGRNYASFVMTGKISA